MKPSAENCSKCGEQHHPRNCKAYGKECFKCKKMNHFAECCNSKTVSVRTEKAQLVKNSRNECNYSSDPWISHLQPVRKSNGTVRLCIDPQNLNQALKRNYYQMPDIDDVLPQLAEAKMFNLCDATDGFLLVKLSNKSSHLTTFWTHYGRYKWKRMSIGISTAPDEFQRRFSSALKGLKGVSVVADDILIYGQDQAEHDDNLRKFLKRVCESGLKLNKKKCRFHMIELPYIRHNLTSEGVKLDPKK